MRVPPWMLAAAALAVACAEVHDLNTVMSALAARYTTPVAVRLTDTTRIELIFSNAPDSIVGDSVRREAFARDAAFVAARAFPHRASLQAVTVGFTQAEGIAPMLHMPRSASYRWTAAELR